VTIGYHPSPNPRSAAVARELLLAGANWRLVDVAGRTARELAALHRQRDVEVFLSEGGSFLCLITPLRSCLYGGLHGGLYERAHIIRYFPPICRCS
jgi:hypothetical protein